MIRSVNENANRRPDMVVFAPQIIIQLIKDSPPTLDWITNHPTVTLHMPLSFVIGSDSELQIPSLPNGYCIYVYQPAKISLP